MIFGVGTAALFGSEHFEPSNGVVVIAEGRFRWPITEDVIDRAVEEKEEELV